MKGFKVVAEDKTHHGFVYQEGLNIDTKPFRAFGSCVPGGLYFFIDIKDVLNWLSYGVYLYEVTVPEGYQCVKDPEGDKYRASGLYISNPRDLREVDTWEYLIQQGADIHAKEEYALRWAANNGHLEVVKFLVQNGADIHTGNDYALRWAAENGHLEIVKFLVESGADIHANDDYALRWASEYGHLAVVKYLVEQGADIHADNDYALSWAAEKGHLAVVKYLVENGANIHAYNDEALSWAAEKGHLEVVEYLKSVGSVYEGI